MSKWEVSRHLLHMSYTYLVVLYKYLHSTAKSTKIQLNNNLYILEPAIVGSSSLYTISFSTHGLLKSFSKISLKVSCTIIVPEHVHEPVLVHVSNIWTMSGIMVNHLPCHHFTFFSVEKTWLFTSSPSPSLLLCMAQSQLARRNYRFLTIHQMLFILFLYCCGELKEIIPFPLSCLHCILICIITCSVSNSNLRAAQDLIFTQGVPYSTN